MWNLFEFYYRHKFLGVSCMTEKVVTRLRHFSKHSKRSLGPVCSPSRAISYNYVIPGQKGRNVWSTCLLVLTLGRWLGKTLLMRYIRQWSQCLHEHQPPPTPPPLPTHTHPATIIFITRRLQLLTSPFQMSYQQTRYSFQAVALGKIYPPTLELLCHFEMQGDLDLLPQFHPCF